jgi:hypothetical protein
VLLCDLILRDACLSNGRHEFVHDGLSVHPPTSSPESGTTVIRAR